MKSPKQMSSLIRAKKKKMEEDPDVIDSGNSPSMDLQDVDLAKRMSETDELDENHPKHEEEESETHESEEHEAMQESHEDNAGINIHIHATSHPIDDESAAAAEKMAEGGEVELDEEDNREAQMMEHEVAPMSSEEMDGPSAEALMRRRARIAKMMSR